MKEIPGLDPALLGGFVERRLGGDLHGLKLEISALRGGLESPGVARVTARYRSSKGPRRFEFVAKALEGETSREADIYESFVSKVEGEIAPELYGVDWLGADRCLLYLEPVRRSRAWPWRETEVTRGVVERLARLHEGSRSRVELPPWDYEAELAESTRTTVEALEGLPRELDSLKLRRSLPALRRVAEDLPAMRRQLFSIPDLRPAALHGDAHPGNVLVRRRQARERPVFLDWGRARVGSPLEDVSSWLQSLGFWEPQARRRHDTLLKAYLKARGLTRRLNRDLRDAYWIAGASNLLAGAVRYFLWAATTVHPSGSPQSLKAFHAAADSLRVIRRADACWRSPVASRVAA
jgi:hypothetical protein